MVDAIVGDETGLFKIVNCSSTNNLLLSSIGNQNRQLGIVGLSDLRNYDLTCTCKYLQDSTIAIQRINGDLEIWKYNNCFEMVSNISLNLNPIGCIKTISNDRKEIISYDSNGLIAISRFNDDDNFYDPVYFNVKGPLSKGDCCSLGGAVFGGKNNDIKMYDINTQSIVWSAKNVTNDKLNLQVPIWITAVKFVNPIEDSVSSGAKIVTGTGYKHIRLYDTRESQRPTISMDVSDDYRVTCLTLSKDGNSVYYGDTVGGLYEWDLRTKRRMHTLHGFAGSIRDIQMNSKGTILSAVGLDRYLRTFDTSSNKLISSCYLKNRLNTSLLFDSIENAVDSNNYSNDIDEQDIVVNYNEDDDDNDDTDEDDDDDNSDYTEVKTKRNKSKYNKNKKMKHRK